jgi:hypothetical protein
MNGSGLLSSDVKVAGSVVGSEGDISHSLELSAAVRVHRLLQNNEIVTK